MKIFKTIFTLVVVCCAIDFSVASLLGDLENKLAQVKDLEKKDVISEALYQLDQLKGLKYMSLKGGNRDSIKQGLIAFREIGSWTHCVSYKMLEQLDPASVLLSKLSNDGVLRQTAQQRVDEYFDKCGERLLRFIRFKKLAVDKVATIAQEISEKAEDLCKNIDKKKSEWKIECIKNLSSTDTVKFTPAIWSGLVKLDKEHGLLPLMNSDIDEFELKDKLVDQVHRELSDTCFTIQASAEGTVIETKFPRSIIKLAQLTSRPVDSADSEILRNLDTGLDLCRFVEWYGEWEKVFADTIVQDYRKYVNMIDNIMKNV